MTLSSRARQILIFLIAGGIGFLIEAITIHIGVSILSSDPQSPRFFSYPVALVWTWYVNRTYGFQMKEAPNFREFFRFVQSNLVAQLTNLALYFMLTSVVASMAQAPLLALVIATVVSTCVSFVLYQIYAFQKPS